MFKVSTELEVPGPGEQLSDPNLKLVEGVGKRGELRYGVFLALVARFPVGHRPPIAEASSIAAWSVLAEVTTSSMSITPWWARPGLAMDVVVPTVDPLAS